MTLPRGLRFGPYELSGQIGAGGMGEVYRARDTRLGREVAIKVLPSAFAADSDRLRRFEQEARATSALNHSNILAIFDLGTHDGAPYIVSELLEGETLRERLNTEPIPPRKSAEYARQIAQGLAAAHEKGIVHRDLKPENLFVTKEGRLKILDFGLARLTLPQGGTESQAATATRTEPGAVLGTVGYMSPEQVRGLATDARSDIFAFGAVVYELLARSRAFQRDSPVETMHAILKDDPPEIEGPGGGGSLERIVRRCLEKDPAERFQSARDLGFALEALSGASATKAIEASPPERTRSSLALRILWPASVCAAAVVALLLARVVYDHPPARFQRLTFRRGFITGARFAPDGRTVVYSAMWDGRSQELFTTRVESPESRTLDLLSTELFSVSAQGELAIAIGKLRPVGAGLGTLARVSLAGGAPRELARDVRTAEWARDGKEMAVVRAAAEGENRLEYPSGTVLYRTRGDIWSPRFSPNGREIAFIEKGDPLDSVVLVDLAGKAKTLTGGWKRAVGLAWNGGEVWFTASTVGWAATVHAVSRAGHVRDVYAAPGPLILWDVLPGGLALVSRDSLRHEAVALAPGETRERDLTCLDASNVAALSRDGKTLLIVERGEGVGGRDAIYVRKTDGSPPVRLGDGWAVDLSPDAEWVLAIRFDKDGQRLVLVPTGAGEPRVLPGTYVSVDSGEFFPDGARILAGVIEKGKKLRTFIQDLKSGERRDVLPDGTLGLMAQNGRSLLVDGEAGEPALRPIEGGPVRPLRGVEPVDDVLAWTADGRSAFVSPRRDLPRRIFRVDVESGARSLVRQLTFADPAGIFAASPPKVTPDGSAYAYNFVRILSDLYLVDGLR